MYLTFKLYFNPFSEFSSGFMKVFIDSKWPIFRRYKKYANAEQLICIRGHMAHITEVVKMRQLARLQFTGEGLGYTITYHL